MTSAEHQALIDQVDDEMMKSALIGRAARELGLEIAFVIDVSPIDRVDADRTISKLQEVVQELIDDGVQVAPQIGVAIRDTRQQILDLLPQGLW